MNNKVIKGLAILYFLFFGVHVMGLFSFQSLLETLAYVYAIQLPLMYVWFAKPSTRALVVGVLGTLWYLALFIAFNSVFATPLIWLTYDSYMLSDYAYGHGHTFFNLLDYKGHYSDYLFEHCFMETLYTLPSFILCFYIAFLSFKSLGKEKANS